MSRRQRGVILTDRGKQRLEAAIASAQDQEKYGARFTQAELEDRVESSSVNRERLDIKTIKNIRDRKARADEKSVRMLFIAFGLELEPADYGQPEPATLPASPESIARRQPSNAKIDWGEKPDTALFFGRTEELATLNQWVQGDQCRLITLLGMGGIGKTSLAAKLANQVYDHFDYVIWRSLREAPPLDEILVRLIQFLSDQQETEINLPTRLGERIIRLLHYLREHRCLVVLDNLESILQAETAGHYRDGYEGYGELIQRIGGTEHQSCLLLTSRECPRELPPLAGDLTPVRLWPVGSIDTDAGREILKTKGLALDEADDQGQELIRRCSGNPQALHLVATAIQREFLGDVDDFLQEQVTAVEDVRSLLDQHLSRLAPLERSVLFWLAINREPVGLDELMEDLLPPVTKQEVRGAVRGLSDRYLIETVGKQFTLQNVIMEFATDRFVEQVCIELQTCSFDLFHTHALIKANAKDYVRETQVRLILESVADYIDNLEKKIGESIIIIRQHPRWINGYAAGNFLNILCQTQLGIFYDDFSTLNLRQVHLEGVNLHRLNLSNSRLINFSLTQAFGTIQGTAFSPDGKIMAMGDSYGNIQLWLFKEHKYLTTLEGHNNWIWSIAFSPDGQLLASGSEDSTVRLWDIQQRRCLHIFTGHSKWVRSVAFSPDCQFIVSGSGDTTVRLWDIQKRQCIYVFSGHTQGVWSVAFSPNANIFASASEDTTVRLWDIQTRRCLHILTGHKNRVWSVAFSPDGQFIASGSEDTTIRLWDFRKHKCLRVFTEHTNWVWSVAFSPDSQFLASGSDDSTVRLWDVQKHQCIDVFMGHSNGVWSVAFSHDGQFLASGSEDATVRLWNIQKHQCIHVFSGHMNWIWSVAFGSDGQFFASGSEDGIVRLWDIQRYQCLQEFTGHTNWVWSVTFSPNSKFIASGSEDTTIRLWDIRQHQCSYVFTGHTDCVRSVAFSPDGQYIASGSDDSTIRLWDVQQHRCLYVFSGHTKGIRSVTFSPNGQFLASGSEDATVRLWDVQQRQCLYTFKGHTNWVRSIAFSPDGQFLASGSEDATVRLWDVQQRQCLHVFTGHTSWIWSIAYSPDAQLLASGSGDATSRLWDIQRRQCLHIFADHTNWVRSVAFSSDAQTLASGSNNGTIWLWNVQTGDSLGMLQVPRPYEGTNITGIKGLSEVQFASLLTLGAVDYSEELTFSDLGSSSR